MSKYRLKRLSASSIQTYLQCLLKYYYTYFSKEEPIEDRTAMNFGTAVHYGLEHIGKEIMAGRPLTASLCDEAISHFLTKCAALKIENSSLINEGTELIKDRLNKHNTNYKIIAVEHRFKDITTDGGTPLGGYADLILEVNPDTALVVDYKTSKMAKTQQEVDTDIQLSLYDYMFHKQFPQYSDVWLALDFVKQKTVLSRRTEDFRDYFGEYLDRLYAEMGNLKKVDLQPKVNKFCNWCGYKHLCPAYANIVKKKFEITPLEALNEDNFVEEWHRLSESIKILEGRKKELKEWATSKIIDSGVNSFGDAVYTQQKESVKYDIDKITPYVNKEELAQFVTIKKSNFEKFITERPELREVLDYAISYSYSAPYLVVKQPKEEKEEEK